VDKVPVVTVPNGGVCCREPQPVDVPVELTGQAYCDQTNPGNGLEVYPNTTHYNAQSCIEIDKVPVVSVPSGGVCCREPAAPVSGAATDPADLTGQAFCAQTNPGNGLRVYPRAFFARSSCPAGSSPLVSPRSGGGVCCRGPQDYTIPSGYPQSSVLDGLVNEIEAQTETPGRVLQASDGDSITIQESGRYALFQDGSRIAEQDVIVLANEVEVRLYTDENGNGVKDGDEEYFTDYSTISIAREATAEEYNLNSGWNLINLPMIDTRSDKPVRTAGDLIDYWATQGGEVTQVASFSNGSFDVFSKRETGTEFAPDFDLIPGEAIYVYNTSTNRALTFSGNRFEESVPVQLSNGWNLVGIVAPNTDYDSEGVLNALSDQGFDASTISQFENGLYQSVISDEDVIFGNNFNVIDKRGYFIRVESGGDNQFTP
jgi:hypothetical protein